MYTMETNVTIVSTNLNRQLLENYNDYFVIGSDFTYEELLLKKKVLFFNILNNIKVDVLKKIFSFLKDNKIDFINVTNNIEQSLFTDYLIVYDKNKVLMEGNTLGVLENAKLLKRLGLQLPFIVDLSMLLKDYGVVDKIYLDKESLVDNIW